MGGEQALQINVLEVDGDRLQLRADVRASPESEHDLVWGKLGVLRAGLERVDGENDWKLVNSENWFYERKEALGY